MAVCASGVGDWDVAVWVAKLYKFFYGFIKDINTLIEYSILHKKMQKLSDNHWILNFYLKFLFYGERAL